MDLFEILMLKGTRGAGELAKRDGSERVGSRCIGWIIVGGLIPPTVRGYQCMGHNGDPLQDAVRLGEVSGWRIFGRRARFSRFLGASPVGETALKGSGASRTHY